MIKFKLFKYVCYAIVFAGIFVCAYFNNKIIETIFLLLSFIYLRYTFPKTFHHPNFYWCIFWSIVIFWVAIPSTLNLSISILSSVLVGFIMTYILFKIEDYIELKDKYANKNIWQMAENELREYCRLKGIKNERIEFVVYLVIHQWSFSDIANKLGYSRETLKDWSKSCKKKLNIKSWDISKN